MCKCDECTGGIPEDEGHGLLHNVQPYFSTDDDHHDNSYEDGDESTGTVEDYEIDWSAATWNTTLDALPSWIRVVYVGTEPTPTRRRTMQQAARSYDGPYAVEIDSDFGPVIHFRGTLRECAAEALRIENYDGPNA